MVVTLSYEPRPLQAQIHNDFPMYPMLMGRSNYPCNYSDSVARRFPDITCEDCVGGKEQWLFFTIGEGKRGSCVTRAECLSFQADGTLPSWWGTYHGVTNDMEVAR